MICLSSHTMNEIAKTIRATKKTMISEKAENIMIQIPIITPLTLEETNQQQSYTGNMKSVTVTLKEKRIKTTQTQSIHVIKKHLYCTTSFLKKRYKEGKINMHPSCHYHEVTPMPS